jgi:hypothetical protein
MKNQRISNFELFFALIIELDYRVKSLSKWQNHLSLSGLFLTDDLVSIILKRLSSFNIPHLTSLSLRENLLTKIPPECLGLPFLTRLALGSNPISSPAEQELCARISYYPTLAKPYLIGRYQSMFPSLLNGAEILPSGAEERGSVSLMSAASFQSASQASASPKRIGSIFRRIKKPLSCSIIKPQSSNFSQSFSKKSTNPNVIVIPLPIHGDVMLSSSRLTIDDACYTNLREAGLSGNTDILAHLLDQGKIPSIDAAISEGRTFIHLLFESSSLSRDSRIFALQFCFSHGVTQMSAIS